MADNFASYFPVSITGGEVNPATGLDAVQGQTPQPLGLDLILQGIQSQYTPQTFTQSGGSYGAGRFIDGGGSVAGVGQSVGGNTAPSWFLPGEFNLADYQEVIPQEVAQKVATGEIYGGSDYSPVSNTESSGWQNDPYSSLFNPMPNAARVIAAKAIPGAGLALGAAMGYQNALGTNAMNTALGAYGSEGMGNVDPFTAALMGAAGITPSSVKGAQAMASNFDSPENMYGYMAAAQDPAISQIAESMIAQSGGTMNANQVGALGYAIGEAVNAQVAAGMSLNDAVQSVATGYGVAPSEAAAMAANLSVADPLGQLISNLQPQAMAPAPTSNAAQAEQAAQQALAAVSAAGGSVSQAQAESIANTTADPIAAMNAIQGWTGSTTAPQTSNAPNQSDTYGGYVSDSQGQAVQTSSGPLGFGDAPTSAPAGNNPDEADPGDTGGGGGGSSKIVCTAMNQSYGFGSYRNAIWLKYSADKMTKAHEAGYHAIFLPLVDLAYKRNNKPVRIALEHIARHRTADLRAEMRNSKRDNIGRAYRFILEPLCYIVGKIKGY
jgi:hypothetical protein